LSTCASSYRALAHVGDLTALVDAKSGRAVLLKGVELAHRLYGDVSARPSADLDLLAPPSSRAAVSRAAIELGWSHVEGSPPGDEVFVRRDPDGDLFLEIHARLLGDRLAFLDLPDPAAARLDLDGVGVSAMRDPIEAAYLAAHLATHFAPPLLWWLDWWTLWSRTDAAGRAAAARAATDAGLAGYLRWAERRGAAVAAAIDGDDAALAMLGIRASGERRDVHQIVRHVTLAATPRAAATAVREWVRPEWAAERDGGIVVGTARRLARHWRLLLPATVGAPDRRVSSRQKLAGPEDAARIHELVAAGGEAWLPVGGASMSPAIGAGDSVLLTRLRGEPRPGDIVLNAAGRVPMLHRVTSTRPGVVTTRGDACETDDPDAPADAIVARAVAMRRGDVVVALTPSVRFGLAALVRFWLRSLRGRRGARRRPA
jgi:hypothetical protein